MISASNLSLFYGGVEVFSGVDLEAPERARIGVVGPNGSGKTSLLRILVGEMEPSGGEIHVPQGLRVGYVPQVPGSAAEGTLRDHVLTAFGELVDLELALSASATAMERETAAERGAEGERYVTLLNRYEGLGGYTYLSDVDRVASGVGLSEEALQTPANAASGGEQTRAALAKALLSDPDLLVLDEPTNHLDFAGLRWLEGFLGRYAHAVVVVSHDRYFLDRVVTRIWDLDEGRLLTYPGSFSKYRVLKAERLVRQRKEYESQQEFIAKEELFIARYHSGQRAREARGRSTRLDKLRRIKAPLREESVSLARVSASRTGEVVLRTRDLEVGFGAGARRVKLLSMPDTELHRGSRTAIIGSNGIGKTTLLRTVLGLMPALQGEAGLGHNVRPGYLPQGQDMLPEDAMVLDAFLDAKGTSFGEARSYLARFMFTGEEVFQRVGSLSGGERARLRLARLMVTEPNFLVFDEPTTHLDIPSREALERVLMAYDGTLLFVSHDRVLISMLAEQLWVAADGAVQVFDGGFDAWLESAPEPEAPSTARAAPRPRAGPRGPSAKAVRAAVAEQELEITELETRLEAIELGLEEASERRDVVEIARLGREHGDTLRGLERRLEEWGGRA